MQSIQRTLGVVFALILSLIPPSLAQNLATETQTLWSQDVYSSQKPCAQGCFLGDFAGCGIDEVASAIGCNYNYCGNSIGATNGCYCRTDLQSVAQSYVSECVKTKCTIGDSEIDISSAVSIYDAYCVANGFAVDVPATHTSAAQPTTGAAPGNTATSPSPAQTSGNSNNNNNNNNNSNGGNTQIVNVGGKGSASSLSKPGKITVGVTIPLAVAAVAGLCWYFMSRRRRGRQQSRERGGAAADEQEYRNVDFKSELDGRQEPRNSVSVDVLKSTVDQSAVEVPDSSVP